MGAMKTLTHEMLSNRFFAFLDAGNMHSRSEALGALMIFWHACHSRAMEFGTIDELRKLMPGNDTARSLMFSAMLDAGYLEPSDATGTRYHVVENGLYDEPPGLRSDRRSVKKIEAEKRAMKKLAQTKAQTTRPEPQPEPSGLEPAPVLAAVARTLVATAPEATTLFAPQTPAGTPQEQFERNAARQCFDTYARFVHLRCGTMPQNTPVGIADLRFAIRRVGLERTQEILRFYVQQRSEPHLVRDRWPLHYFRKNIDGLDKLAKVAEATIQANLAVERSTKAALAP